MKLLKQNSQIEGYLEYDPELRYTPMGHAICSLTITKMNGDSIRAECWNTLAEEVAEHYQRQTPIIAWGSMKIRKWDDKEDNPHEYEYFSVTCIERNSP